MKIPAALAGAEAEPMTDEEKALRLTHSEALKKDAVTSVAPEAPAGASKAAAVVDEVGRNY